MWASCSMSWIRDSSSPLQVTAEARGTNGTLQSKQRGLTSMDVCIEHSISDCMYRASSMTQIYPMISLFSPSLKSYSGTSRLRGAGPLRARPEMS